MSSCHDTSSAVRPPSGVATSTPPVRLALAGSPNVGKSTVFNLLTGLSQHTGNWTGKTVEQKVGYHQHDGRIVEIIDLPGTYSLTASSVEEQVARDYLLVQPADVTVVVTSAANLERNLYFVAELLELPTPLVVGVNMIDVAAAEGIRVETDVLAAALGVPVVPLVATRADGVGPLVAAAVRLAGDASEFRPRRPRFEGRTEEIVARVAALIDGSLPGSHPSRWTATKLLEGDAAIHDFVRERLSADRFAELDRLLAANEDAVVAIASARYEWVGRMVRAAVFLPREGAISRTERLDRAATHPVFGPLVLLGVLGVIFWAVYQIAEPFIGLLEEVVTVLGDGAHSVLDPITPWLGGLIADGLIGGAGTVLTLLPVIAIFFLAMAFLEDVGYMARAAFVADRYMHKLGLHGKSFLPLFLGFGCNVPAVLGTRVIESPRARLITIFLSGLVPCSARIGVLVFVSVALFGGNAPLVTWGLVAMAIGILAVTGVVVSRFVMRGSSPAFIMELPLYHTPNWRNVSITTWLRVREFVIRAGTLIAVMSAVIWAVSMLPSGDVESGYLATFGRALQPLGSLMGLSDWRLIVALLTSFVAKENTIATLGVLTTAEEAGLATVLPTLLTPAAGLAFLVVQVLFIPCVGTVSAIHQETRSLRLTVSIVLYQLLLSLAGGVVVYQIASLLGLGG